jgi:hypothetical protein
MRVGSVRPPLAIGILAASFALAQPQPAQAGLFGLITAPLRVLAHGFGGHHLHHFRHHDEAPQSTTSRGAPETAHESSGPTSTAATPPPSGAASRTARPVAALAVAWPTASPNVYEDLLGYAFWPHDYADRLWSHGYADIMNALVTPTAATPPTTDQAADLIATGMCSDQAKALAEQPLTRVEQQLALSSSQQMALDGLRTALGDAVDRGKATVCGQASSEPVDRVKRMIDGLWSMWDATIVLSTPLGTFYNSLTDAQKQKLDDNAVAGAVTACTDQRPVAFPGGVADRSPRAAKESTADLRALRERSAEMVKYLVTSCPGASATTPVSRLRAATTRMNALLYVVINMNPSRARDLGATDTTQKN